MTIRNQLVTLMFVLLSCYSQAYAQDISDYLILNDIGGYKASKNPTTGKGPGILAGAAHFYVDHTDTSSEIGYYNLQIRGGGGG